MHKIYVKINNEGSALGFYNEEINQFIPENAIEISEEIWLQWSANTNGLRWHEGSLVKRELAPAEPPPPPVGITYKTDVWLRCSEAEAALLDAALQASPVRLRRLWDDAQRLEHGSPAFATLREAMVSEFGEERTNEILATS